MTALGRGRWLSPSLTRTHIIAVRCVVPNRQSISMRGCARHSVHRFVHQSSYNNRHRDVTEGQVFPQGIFYFNASNE